MCWRCWAPSKFLTCPVEAHTHSHIHSISIFSHTHCPAPYSRFCHCWLIVGVVGLSTREMPLAALIAAPFGSSFNASSPQVAIPTVAVCRRVALAACNLWQWHWQTVSLGLREESGGICWFFPVVHAYFNFYQLKMHSLLGKASLKEMKEGREGGREVRKQRELNARGVACCDLQFIL